VSDPRDLTVHDWIMTASGRPFWTLDPRVEDVHIEDIAQALAAIPRFHGHTRPRPYSVAQHSVLVSDYAEQSQVIPCGARRRIAFAALLHDASEAYLGDVPRPLKRQPTFAAYRDAEARLQRVIDEAFGVMLTDDEKRVIAAIDRRMLRTEQRDLMPPAIPGEGRDDVEPYPFIVAPWPFTLARRRFLMRVRVLSSTNATGYATTSAH